MGVIEISDGVTNRQIPVQELTETIRIELAQDGPRLILPPSVTVEYTEQPERSTIRGKDGERPTVR